MEIGCLPLNIHPLSLSLLLKFVSLYLIEKLYTIKSIDSFCPVPAHSVLPAPANDNEHSQMDGNRSQDPGGAIAVTCGRIRCGSIDRTYLQMHLLSMLPLLPFHKPPPRTPFRAALWFIHSRSRAHRLANTMI